jgi:hypothetical protein
MIRSLVLLLHIAERPVFNWREAVKSKMPQLSAILPFAKREMAARPPRRARIPGYTARLELRALEDRRDCP